MTRHTLRPGTACVHPVRDNVVEFCRPDLPPLDGDALIIEQGAYIEALEWTLMGLARIWVVTFWVALVGWALWWLWR